MRLLSCPIARYEPAPKKFEPETRTRQSPRYADKAWYECLITAENMTAAKRIAPACDSIPRKVCGCWGAAQMPDYKLLALARDLRARVEEVLAKAETMSDADAREMMYAVAARYEALARRVEQQADDA